MNLPQVLQSVPSAPTLIAAVRLGTPSVLRLMFVALLAAFVYFAIAPASYSVAAAPAGPNPFRSGPVDIEVTVVNDWSMTGKALGPGAVSERRMRVSNQSDVAMYYTVSAYSEGPETTLWTDTDNGLQIQVRAGTDLLYSGPIAELTGAARGVALEGFEFEELVFTVTFPLASGNDLQGVSQGVGFTFHASGR